ncbi:MAG: paaI, partial [Sporomusa sp.]|nr:paaI [Sporomusa sp.]
VECQQTITAVASLIHNGRQTMVAETEIFDDMHNLLVKARGTFFVTGNFL